MLEVLDGRLFGPGQPCFGCAPDHPFGLHLAFERTDDGVVTRFVPGDHHQGPPGIMHGGLVMAIADEVGAWAVLAAHERFGFTAQMEAKLHRPARINVELIAKGRVVRTTRRVVSVEVTIEQAGGRVFEAALKFMMLDAAASERLLGQSLPEAWRRFAHGEP